MISDGRLSASSQWSASSGANKARLHATGPLGSWSSLTNDANQWLQIDVLRLGRKYPKVTRVATQGKSSDDLQQWVTKYKLQFSNDGINFHYYKEEGQKTDKVRQISSELCFKKVASQNYNSRLIVDQQGLVFRIPCVDSFESKKS